MVLINYFFRCKGKEKNVSTNVKLWEICIKKEPR